MSNDRDLGRWHRRRKAALHLELQLLRLLASHSQGRAGQPDPHGQRMDSDKASGASFVRREAREGGQRMSEKEKPHCFGSMDLLKTGNCGECEYESECWDLSFDFAEDEEENRKEAWEEA